MSSTDAAAAMKEEGDAANEEAEMKEGEENSAAAVSRILLLHLPTNTVGVWHCDI
jgi:hypothetical protein